MSRRRERAQYQHVSEFKLRKMASPVKANADMSRRRGRAQFQHVSELKLRKMASPGSRFAIP